MSKRNTAAALKWLGQNLKVSSSHQRRGAFEQFGVVLSKKKLIILNSLIYPVPVHQNPGSKLALRTASCPEFSRWVQVLGAQVHGPTVWKFTVVAPTYIWALRWVARMFVFLKNKCTSGICSSCVKQLYLKISTNRRTCVKKQRRKAVKIILRISFIIKNQLNLPKNPLNREYQ
jgi:hypothetical protein